MNAGAGEPRSDDDWWESLTDDERDRIVASANNGSADDYSHLDELVGKDWYIGDDNRWHNDKTGESMDRSWLD